MLCTLLLANINLKFDVKWAAMKIVLKSNLLTTWRGCVFYFACTNGVEYGVVDGVEVNSKMIYFLK
jgi:hypothetical protein